MKKTTSHKAARRPAKHTDLYRQITDRIVVALENGVAPGVSRGARLPASVWPVCP